jgi:hypothetical protein
MKLARQFFFYAALIVGAFCMPASLSAIQIVQTSATTFFKDTGVAPMAQCAYASYQVTNNGASTLPDVWAQIGPFSLPANMGVAPSGASSSHLGQLDPGQSKMAFFYLCGTVTGNTASITYTVGVYAAPPPNSPLLSQTFTYVPFGGAGGVQDTIEAGSNQVSAILSGPKPPALGGVVTLSVSGSTGTIGGANLLVFSPATSYAWPSQTFQMVSATVLFYSPSPVTYINQLSITYTTSTSYLATYYFRATASTVTNTTTSPVNYINSGGTNMKHTNLSQGAYQTGSGNIDVVTPPTNAVSLTATAAASALTYPASTLVTVRVTNSGSNNVDLDGFQLAVPTGPGTVQAVTGTSTFNGVATSDPLVSSGQVLWSGIYTVPAGTFRDFTYQLTVLPPNSGFYFVSQTALIGSTSIDTTTALGDNAPAAFGVSMHLPLSLTATAGTANMVYPNAVSVTVRVSNSGTGAIALDTLKLAVPTSPGSPFAVTGTSTFNGVAIADPVASSGLLTWSGTFTVPAGGFRDFFYYVAFPASAGFFYMSQTAEVRGAVVDLTVNSNDTAPATFGVTQLLPTATPTSTSTPTPTCTASPSSTVTPTFTATPSCTASPSFTRTLTPVACHVMISAITSNGSSVNDKVVQLYYSCGSGACLDISGWKIRDRGPGCVSVTDLFTFPAGSIIAPNTYVLLATSAYLPVSYGAGSQPADYSTLAVFGATGRAIELWNGTYAEDLVGINGSACAEGASVGAIGAAQIARRNPAGTDTDSNSADFTVNAISSVTLLAGGNVCVPTPTCTISGTSTASPTASPSATPSATPTRTQTPTATPTGTPTATPSATPTATATHTPTQTVSPTFSNTESFTFGPSPTNTHTPTVTQTSTHSPTATRTSTASATPSSSSTNTPTATPTDTATGTATGTPSVSPTDTATASPTATPTDTATGSATQTPTGTISPTFSSTQSFTSGPSPTYSSTPTFTQTPTQSPTATATETSTASPSATATQTATASPSSSSTETPTASPTASDTETSTASPTATETSTSTASPSVTATPTLTVSPFGTSTDSPTTTETPTTSPTETATDTATASPSSTGTETPSATGTESSSPSATASETSTATETGTASPSATATETGTETATASPTATATETPTAVDTDTFTAVSSPTSSATPTETPSSTQSYTESPTPTVTPTSTTVPTSYPSPVFSSVSQSGTSSSGGFSITVTGSGFLPGAQIWVDGQPLVTTYINATTLVATAPAHSPGSFTVQVSNLGPVFAVAAGSVNFVGPPEDLLLAPMPVHRGQPLCLYSEQPLADSQWTVFGADQQVVARLSSGDAKPCFTRTGDLVPGVYIVRIRTRTQGGRTTTVVRNLVIEP